MDDEKAGFAPIDLHRVRMLGLEWIHALCSEHVIGMHLFSGALVMIATLACVLGLKCHLAKRSISYLGYSPDFANLRWQRHTSSASSQSSWRNKRHQRSVQKFTEGLEMTLTEPVLGMTYLRAETAQIDLWEQFGNEGWSWESLIPYYKKSEYIQKPTSSQILRGASINPGTHGASGPMAVGWTEDGLDQDILSSVNQTFGALGLPFNKEPNSGSMRGFTVFPKTVDRANNVREDAARAYY